nr:hypothetical protein CFP56_77329 [Quercus suber]
MLAEKYSSQSLCLKRPRTHNDQATREGAGETIGERRKQRRVSPHLRANPNPGTRQYMGERIQSKSSTALSRVRSVAQRILRKGSAHKVVFEPGSGSRELASEGLVAQHEHLG